MKKITVSLLIICTVFVALVYCAESKKQASNGVNDKNSQSSPPSSTEDPKPKNQKQQVKDKSPRANDAQTEQLKDKARIGDLILERDSLNNQIKKLGQDKDIQIGRIKDSLNTQIEQLERNKNTQIKRLRDTLNMRTDELAQNKLLLSTRILELERKQNTQIGRLRDSLSSRIFELEREKNTQIRQLRDSLNTQIERLKDTLNIRTRQLTHESTKIQNVLGYYKRPSFDELVNSTNRLSHEQAKQLAVGNAEFDNILLNLERYFKAEQLLSKPFNQEKINSALGILELIRPQSPKLESLINKLNDYKDYNDALKETVKNIRDLDKGFTADGIKKRQEEKYNKILFLLGNYMHNNSDYVNYPHLSKNILEIIRLKYENADDPMKDVLK